MSTEIDSKKQLARLCDAVKTILECIGEDPGRNGLLDTPTRYAQALLFFTKGNDDNLDSIVNNAVFQEDHNELVLLKNIEIFSMCEHHLVPFTGKVCNVVALNKARLLNLLIDAHWIYS